MRRLLVISPPVSNYRFDEREWQLLVTRKVEAVERVSRVNILDLTENVRLETPVNKFRIEMDCATCEACRPSSCTHQLSNAKRAHVV